MDKIATERLFLLELLVDKITLTKKCQCDSPSGETCVSFTFLDNPPMDVCEEDFDPKRDYRGVDDPVKSGKSCLFSLSPAQASECLKKFDITVTVWKKIPNEEPPEKVEIGNATIPVADIFSLLIDAVKVSDGISPLAKMLKDEFDITNEDGKLVGTLSAYTRITCFGKLIITQFQMNLDDKSVLFKDNQGKSMYKYKKVGKKYKQDTSYSQDNLNQYPTGNMGYPGASPNQFGEGYPGGGYGQQGAGGSPYGMAPCQECGQIPNAPCISPGMGMGGAMTPCIECGNIPNAPCLPPPPPGLGQMSNTPCEDCANIPGAPCAIPPPPEPEPDPDGNYQELCATMGGNTFKIRIHKNKEVIEQVDPTSPNSSQTPSGNVSPNNSVTSSQGSRRGCRCMPGQVGKKRRSR